MKLSVAKLGNYSNYSSSWRTMDTSLKPGGIPHGHFHQIGTDLLDGFIALLLAHVHNHTLVCVGANLFEVGMKQLRREMGKVTNVAFSNMFPSGCAEEREETRRSVGIPRSVLMMPMIPVSL